MAATLFTKNTTKVPPRQWKRCRSRGVIGRASMESRPNGSAKSAISSATKHLNTSARLSTAKKGRTACFKRPIVKSWGRAEMSIGTPMAMKSLNAVGSVLLCMSWDAASHGMQAEQEESPNQYLEAEPPNKHDDNAGTRHVRGMRSPPLLLAGGAIEAALVDLSGTLHVGPRAVPGAPAACRRLHRSGVKVLYLTNTSKQSSSSLLRQLREAGFDESAVPGMDSIMTSVGAARRCLSERGLRPYCLVEDELLEAELAGIETGDPNCVLVGLAPSKLDYPRLNEAYRMLSKWKDEDDGNDGDDSKPRLVAIHRGAYYRDADGELSLGPGEFVSLLERSSGVSARVMGKPSPDFYRTALSSLGVDDPARAVMIGDDVVGDVAGALDAGFGGALLVKTGKYKEGDEGGGKTGGIVPTRTVDSIVEAVDCIVQSVEIVSDA
ncbi:hypothetical protein ACHAWF_018343 [Thalassiosira exigua]